MHWIREMCSTFSPEFSRPLAEPMIELCALLQKGRRDGGLNPADKQRLQCLALSLGILDEQKLNTLLASLPPGK